MNHFFRIAILCCFVVVTARLGPALGRCDEPAVSQIDRPSESIDEFSVELAGIDYLQFWLMAEAQREPNIGSIYLESDHDKVYAYAEKLAVEQKSKRLLSHLYMNRALYKTHLQPTGSPFFYTSFSCFRTGTYELDFWIFQMVSVLALVIGLCLVGRSVDIGFVGCLLICGAVAAFFLPFRTELAVANINRLQVFVIGLLIWLLAKPQPAFSFIGMIMGLAVVFKLNFLLLPVFVCSGCLIERRFLGLGKMVAGLVLGALAGFTLAAKYFDDSLATSDCWQLWYQYVNQIMAQPYSASLENYSLVAQFQPSQHQWIAASVLGISWLLACVASAWKKRAPHDGGQIGSAHSALPMWAATAPLVFLMGSPLVLSHEYLLALPCFVVLIGYCRKHQTVVVEGVEPVSKVVWRKSILFPLLLASILFVVVSNRFVASGPLAITIQLQAGVGLLFLTALVVMMGDRCETVIGPSDSPLGKSSNQLEGEATAFTG